MKRQNHLFERIVEYENIRLAWTKAIKGKRFSKPVLLYRHNLDKNLEKLRLSLLCGTVTWGPYKQFTITDPKERVISVAPLENRVLHHAIMNIAESAFEKQMVFHTYACRKEKGTHAALRYAFSKSKSFPWFLKLDIRKYFDSIDHDVLKKCLEHIFKDKKLLALFVGIIDSYCTAPGKGVPIGNLSSQYFANLYLSTIDHFILEKLRPRSYVRYMDDFVLWGTNQTELKKALLEIEKFTAANLSVKLKSPVLGKTEYGLPFLGFLIKSSGIYLMQKSKKRLAGRIGEIKSGIEKGKLHLEKAVEKILSVYASVHLARTRAFRVKL
jgi:retron-type reverse transcriptase